MRFQACLKRCVSVPYSVFLFYYPLHRGIDGSISEWTWSRGTGSTAQTYAFSYDGLGRLTETKRYTGTGTTATNAFTEKGITEEAISF